MRLVLPFLVHKVFHRKVNYLIATRLRGQSRFDEVVDHRSKLWMGPEILFIFEPKLVLVMKTGEEIAVLGE